MFSRKHNLPRPAAHPRRHAFTLMELLVVVTIIVALIAILLPSLGAVQNRAYRARTLALMSNLQSDIDAYFQRFHAYPGPMSAAVVAQNLGPPTKISGSQNMLLGLTYPMALAGNNVVLPSAPFKPTGPVDYATVTPTGNYEQLPPYFSPTSNQTMAANTTTPNTHPDIPVVFDAFPNGLPILYFRRNVGVDTPAASVVLSSPPAAYSVNDNIEYLNGGVTSTSGSVFYQGSSLQSNQPALGSAYFDVPELTYAATGATPPSNRAMPPATTAARGGYLLISAGIDRYYGSYRIYNSGAYKDDDLILVGGE